MHKKQATETCQHRKNLVGQKRTCLTSLCDLWNDRTCLRASRTVEKASPNEKPFVDLFFSPQTVLIMHTHTQFYEYRYAAGTSLLMFCTCAGWSGGFWFGLRQVKARFAKPIIWPRRPVALQVAEIDGTWKKQKYNLYHSLFFLAWTRKKICQMRPMNDVVKHGFIINTVTQE